MLHATEIGLGNDCLDSFLNFVNDRVESLSNEEKMARNDHVVADAGLDCAVNKLADFRESGAINLLSYHTKRANLIKFLNIQVNEHEQKYNLLKEKRN